MLKSKGGHFVGENMELGRGSVPRPCTGRKIGPGREDALVAGGGRQTKMFCLGKGRKSIIFEYIKTTNTYVVW